MQRESVNQKRGVSARNWIVWLAVLIAAPATLLVAWRFGNRKYYLSSLLLIVYAMLPFFVRFEHKKPQARERLIEWYLPLICQMADEYDGGEIPAEDLIQEGNIGLLLAMDTLDTFDSPAACQAHLLNCVNQAMEDAIHANEETKKSNEGIVSRVNHLNEAIHR